MQPSFASKYYKIAGWTTAGLLACVSYYCFTQSELELYEINQEEWQDKEQEENRDELKKKDVDMSEAKTLVDKVEKINCIDVVQWEALREYAKEEVLFYH